MLDTAFKIKEEAGDLGFATFVIEPLTQGYGHTLGNALRRVLLSSLKGAAITTVKIEGVRHQFSTVLGLKEDVVELILNIKKVRLQFEISNDEEVTLTLVKQGPGMVTAGDIKTPPGVNVVNPDLYLGTLADKKSKLDIEFIAKTGYGYETSAEKQVTTIGYIPVDSLFSPVVRVNYRVESTRVGRMTNLDKLVMEIWTDATISPRAAIEEAARILSSYFRQVYEPTEKVIEEGVSVPTGPDEVMKMRIEELDIPTRIVNALENGNIETIGQLMAAPRPELMKIKNLGAKSLSIIEEKIKEKGIVLS